MMPRPVLALLLAAAIAVPALSGSPVAPGAQLVKVADGFRFTEGPSSDAAGNVYFTDQPNDRIHRWDASTGKVELFLEPSGRANGLCFAPDGKLWACADGLNELWRIDVTTKKTDVVVKNHDGKLLNGPNDVWVGPDGGVYFTDPFFKRPYWKHRGEQPAAQLPAKHVYFVAPGAREAVRVTGANDLSSINGLVGTPDGKILYVADPRAKKIVAFDILPDGKLANPRPFADGAADGLTLDDEGNLYLAAKGVSIVDQNGAPVETIAVPEGWVGNVCFGGRDMKTLFITASKGVYTLQMRVRGAGRQ